MPLSALRKRRLISSSLYCWSAFFVGECSENLSDAIIAVTSAVVALWLLRPGGPRMVSAAKLKRSLGYSLPMVPHSLITQINSLAGRFLINRYLGLAATGVYSMGHQIGNIGTVVGTALNQAYSPLFMREVKKHEKLLAAGDAQEAQRMLQNVSNVALIMVATSVGLAFMLTGYAREMLIIFTTPAYYDCWRITVIISAASVVRVSYYAISQVLIYSVRGVRMLPMISGAAMLTNVGMNMLLLPRLGYIGSAWAALSADTVMATMAFFIGRHFMVLPYRMGRWLGVYVSAVIGLLSLHYLDEYTAALALRVPAKTAVITVMGLAAMRSANLSPRDFLSFARSLFNREKSGTPEPDNGMIRDDAEY